MNLVDQLQELNGKLVVKMITGSNVFILFLFIQLTICLKSRFFNLRSDTYGTQHTGSLVQFNL